MINIDIVKELEKIILMADSLRANVMLNDKPKLSIVKNAKIIDFAECGNLQNSAEKKDNIKKARNSNIALQNRVYEIDRQQKEDDYDMPINLKYGQGSISKVIRKNKTTKDYIYWQYRYYDKFGKQRYMTAKTKEQCIKKIKEFLEVEKPKKETNGYNLNDWLEFWYKTFSKPNISENTAKGYETILKKHILPSVGEKKLCKLTNADIQICLNAIESSRQRLATKNILFTSLKEAYNERLIKIEPWNTVKIKAHRYKEKNILTHEDEPKLLALLAEPYQSAVVGYLYTGCRLSELINVKEKDIDRVNKIITINGTKTKNSIRKIPLFPQVETILPIEIDNVRHLQDAFKDARNKLGLDITIHDLRHTFATRCCEKGINIKTVQKWLGHSSYTTTANIYTHLDREFEKSEIDKFLN